ncbi:MFS transporter, partial [Dermatophilus congolensis]
KQHTPTTPRPENRATSAQEAWDHARGITSTPTEAATTEETPKTSRPGANWGWPSSSAFGTIKKKPEEHTTAPAKKEPSPEPRPRRTQKEQWTEPATPPIPARHNAHDTDSTHDDWDTPNIRDRWDQENNQPTRQTPWDQRRNESHPRQRQEQSHSRRNEHEYEHDHDESARTTRIPSGDDDNWAQRRRPRRPEEWGPTGNPRHPHWGENDEREQARSHERELPHNYWDEDPDDEEEPPDQARTQALQTQVAPRDNRNRQTHHDERDQPHERSRERDQPFKPHEARTEAIRARLDQAKTQAIQVRPERPEPHGVTSRRLRQYQEPQTRNARDDYEEDYDNDNDSYEEYTSRGPRILAGRASHKLTALLCWLTIALEGFDLVAFGAAIPTLFENKYLGMTPGDATLIATVSLIGVAIGSILGGPLTDKFGRRGGLMAAIALFSFSTIAVPLTPSIPFFAAARFLAGIGLGASMPIAIATATESGRHDRKASSTTMTMTGYHVGAVLISIVAMTVLPHWQLLFYIGGAAGLPLIPLVWLFFHDSHSALVPRHNRSTFGDLLSNHKGAILGSWVASFLSLLLVYGLNIWLPQLMRSAGYSLDASLSLLFIMNAGAITGLAIAGIVADRGGIKRSTAIWFAASAVFLALLSIHWENEFILHILMFITGLFVFSAQGLIYAHIAHLIIPSKRGTALGLASGIGRIGAITGPAITGTLLSAGLGHPWGFYVFSGIALLGTLAVLLMPANPRSLR